MKKKLCLVSTRDGSYTLYSSEYEETYHSIGGAKTEARERFLFPCRIPKLLTSERICLLEVGFGLGVNLAETLSFLVRENFQGEFVYFGLEKDQELLEKLPELPRDALWGKVADWILTLAEEKKVFQDTPFPMHLQIVLGRAEVKIKELPQRYFHAVYHDPFSIRKNPELWSESFFNELRLRLRPDGILSTYSSAVAVRLHLLAAGFRIGLGPPAAGKSTGTLASIEAELPPFPPRFFRKLLRRFQRVYGEPPSAYRDFF